jgi:hypothetical protein
MFNLKHFALIRQYGGLDHLGLIFFFPIAVSNTAPSPCSPIFLIVLTDLTGLTWMCSRISGHAPKATPSVRNRTVLPPALSDYLEMKKKTLAAHQLSSVVCPTCGVAVGQRCLLHAGGLRSEPHVDRKLAAIETIKIRGILTRNRANS